MKTFMLLISILVSQASFAGTLYTISNDRQLDAAEGRYGYSVIKYGTTHCGYCRLFDDDFNYISDELKDVRFFEVDTDYYLGDMVSTGTPEFQVYHDGKRLKYWTGYGNPEKFIDRVLDLQGK